MLYIRYYSGEERDKDRANSLSPEKKEQEIMDWLLFGCIWFIIIGLALWAFIGDWLERRR